MVDIAQLVEQLIVVQQVARSSRVIHPMKPRSGGVFVSRHTPQYTMSCLMIFLLFVCAAGAPYVIGADSGTSWSLQKCAQ